MPELPEVENTKEQLKPHIQGQKIKSIEFFRKDLRYPLPQEIKKTLLGEIIQDVYRRAKYIIFDFGKGGDVLSHLGMTGQWRWENCPTKEIHDHIRIDFNNGSLTYNDARRFGYIKYAKNKSFKDLQKLGLEPWDTKLSAQHLMNLATHKRVNVKSFIMDQKYIVGVGNIYASEALFLAGIKPNKPVNHVSLKSWEKLIVHIQTILERAIASGGSTIRDYKSIDGKSGEFQKSHKVYGREGQACSKCSHVIQNLRLSGRSTFWCSNCQK